MRISTKRLILIRGRCIIIRVLLNTVLCLRHILLHVTVTCAHPFSSSHQVCLMRMIIPVYEMLEVSLALCSWVPGCLRDEAAFFFLLIWHFEDGGLVALSSWL